MDKFSGSFYANGTTTRGILKVPGLLETAAKDVARDEWKKVNSGITNASKIAILDGGMDYQNLGMPLKDAEFIESMKFGILEVAKIFKVPPHKLGQLDRATFSNIESQSMDYVKNVLQPIVTSWEQELNYKLLLPSEQKRMYLKFDMTSELRGDSAARVAYYEGMVGIGAMNLDDVRANEDMGPIPGGYGQTYRVDLNHVNIEIADKYQTAKSGASDEKGGDTNEGQGKANAVTSIGSQDGGGGSAD
jgi:HK97 family phage portal protein